MLSITIPAQSLKPISPETSAGHSGQPQRQDSQASDGRLSLDSEASRGEGYGGLTGFLIRLGLKHPQSFAMLLGRLLPMQAAPVPVRHEAPLQPFDDDQYQDKIAELLGTGPVKKK